MQSELKFETHGSAIKALCDCAATVTVLSYQEVVEGYLSLRGCNLPDFEKWLSTRALDPATIVKEVGHG